MNKELPHRFFIILEVFCFPFFFGDTTASVATFVLQITMRLRDANHPALLLMGINSDAIRLVRIRQL